MVMVIGPVLVLGATGSFGGGVAMELLRRGYAVKALVRDVAKARRDLGDHASLMLLEGDVQDPGGLMRAAEGSSVIVHGVNYPDHQWSPSMETATDHVLSAAQSNRATILFPGNVYGLGRQIDVRLTEAAMNQPNSRKGALRLALEESLRKASD